MGAEWATLRGQPFPFRRSALEAGVTAATAAAGAHLGPQFADRELGEQPIHAADRAEIPAPEAFLEAQRTDHRTGGDQQQQAAAQPGGVDQIPHLLPDQDGGETRGQGRRGPAIGFTAGPALGLIAQVSCQPLADLAPDHERTEGTPEPTHQGIGQQDQRPPPGPEQIQGAVVLAILGAEPEPEIHQHEHPAHQAEQQAVPEPGGAHPVAQLWFPAPEVEAGPLRSASASPEHVVGQHLGITAGTALPQGPLNQLRQLPHIAGEVVGLQPFNQLLTDAGRPAPAQAEGLLAHAVAQPFPQILAAHPQGRHPNQLAAAIQIRQCFLRREKDPPRENEASARLIRITPAAVTGQLQQQRSQRRRGQIHLIDQQ